MNTFCSEPDRILAQNQLRMPWTRRALPSLSTAFWAQTTTRSWAWRSPRPRGPARRNRPLNRWIRRTSDRPAASVHTAERFCTRLPVRELSLLQSDQSHTITTDSWFREKACSLRKHTDLKNVWHCFNDGHFLLCFHLSFSSEWYSKDNSIQIFSCKHKGNVTQPL